MRRIFIFGSLLLLVAAAQMAAHSDVFVVSNSAAASVRSLAVRPANLFAFAVGIPLPGHLILRAADLTVLGRGATPERMGVSHLMHVLRC
jgi:hypothetical protein